MKLTVRVPASAANLGPGFDSFGLALQIYNEVTIDTNAEPAIVWEGEGEDELPTDGTDMVSRAIDHVSEISGRDLPPFALHSLNAIPLERGLGSSAAAAVAGVLLASHLVAEDGSVDLHAVLDAATEIEGHPDNAAPAIFGGLTVVYGDSGVPLVLAPSERLWPVACVPLDVRLPTEDARKALPAHVPMADAVFNASHAAAAVIALTTGDQTLLREALKDRLHQQARLALVPEVESVFTEITEAGIPVCVSGAGPTLLAFPSDIDDVPDPGEGWQVLPLVPDLEGAKLTREG